MKSGLKLIFGAQLLAAAVALAACSGLPASSTSTGGSGTGTGFTIGGAVTGLTGTGLVLQDNGGDNLTITKSGPFVFPTGRDRRRHLCRHGRDPADQSASELLGHQRFRRGHG